MQKQFVRKWPTTLDYVNLKALTGNIFKICSTFRRKHLLQLINSINKRTYSEQANDSTFIIGKNCKIQVLENLWGLQRQWSSNKIVSTLSSSFPVPTYMPLPHIYPPSPPPPDTLSNNNPLPRLTNSVVRVMRGKRTEIQQSLIDLRNRLGVHH
jgi:hypothetical protein